MGNFEPRTVVPETGTYECCFCGMGDVFKGMLMGGGTNPENLSKQKRTTRFFEKGSQFEECPSCGPATGWNLLESGGNIKKELQDKGGNTLPLNEKNDLLKDVSIQSSGKKWWEFWK